MQCYLKDRREEREWSEDREKKVGPNLKGNCIEVFNATSIQCNIMVALKHLYKLLITLGNACDTMLNGKSWDIKLYLRYEFNYFKKFIEKRLRGNRLNALWLPLSSVVKGDFWLLL